MTSAVTRPIRRHHRRFAGLFTALRPPWSRVDHPARREGPDDEYVEGHDRNGPQRVVGDPEEVRNRRQPGHGDAYSPGHRVPEEDEQAGHRQNEADEHVDPAPRRGIELKDVVGRAEEELTAVDDG